MELYYLKQKGSWNGNVVAYFVFIGHIQQTFKLKIPRPYNLLCRGREQGNFWFIGGEKEYDANLKNFTKPSQVATLVFSIHIKHGGETLKSGVSWEEVQKSMATLLKDEDAEFWSLYQCGAFVTVRHQYYNLLWTRRQKKKDIVFTLRKHKVDRFRYFKTHSGPIKSSDLMVEDGLGPDYLIDHKTFDQFLRREQKESHPRKEKLLQKMKKDFNSWLLTMYFNHNLLFYGVGSKKKLVQEFFTTTLSFGRRFIVNGYHPSCSVRELVRTIVSKLKVKSENLQLFQLLHQLRLHLQKKNQRHVFILINNIEGPGFRSNENQTLLARLAEIDKIHLVATIDHINAVSLWDPHLESRFRFRRLKISTFESYDLESHVNRTSIITANKEQRVDGIRHVLKSLTPNHRELLETLAEILVEQEKIEDLDGIKFEEFFKACYDSMLVGNDAQFRALTAELVDHHLIETSTSPNGDEIYSIPYTRDVIEQHILKEAE